MAEFLFQIKRTQEFVFVIKAKDMPGALAEIASMTFDEIAEAHQDAKGVGLRESIYPEKIWINEIKRE